VGCLAISLPQVARQFTVRSLKANPITVCVLALLPTVVLSCLMNLSFTGAGYWGSEFFKIVVYYLLFVGLVASPRRIRQFLFWFTHFAVAPMRWGPQLFKRVALLSVLFLVAMYVFIRVFLRW
jgi:hypothetical protein